ncbi:MAG: hypothetical protein K8T10_19010 [Candidatus Eremiobacteraeota bacterium]|nr:hypothetical protein [Candidatus Eremiobacteraeota bacterium]
MKKATLLICLTVLLCLVMISSGWAMRVFVKNRPMGGFFVSKGSLYVNVEEFLKMSRYSWKWNRDSLVVSAVKGGGPRLLKEPGSYNFDGRKFKVSDVYSDGVLYAQAKTLASNIGLEYTYTPSSKTMEFFTASSYLPKSATKKPTTAKSKPTTGSGSTGGIETAQDTGEKSKPGEKKEGKIVTIKEVKKSLIKPKNEYFTDSRMQGGRLTGGVRGEVYFFNSAKEKITNIDIKFMICDGDGTPLQTWNYNVGTLAPNEKTKKYEYYFTNPSSFNINNSSFKYEFTYKEPPKEEKEDKK